MSRFIGIPGIRLKKIMCREVGGRREEKDKRPQERDELKKLTCSAESRFSLESTA